MQTVKTLEEAPSVAEFCGEIQEVKKAIERHQVSAYDLKLYPNGTLKIASTTLKGEFPVTEQALPDLARISKIPALFFQDCDGRFWSVAFNWRLSVEHPDIVIRFSQSALAAFLIISRSTGRLTTYGWALRLKTNMTTFPGPPSIASRQRNKLQPPLLQQQSVRYGPIQPTVKRRIQMKKRTIEIDCPPGNPRPCDLIAGVIKGTGLPLRNNVGYRFFGWWTWDYGDIAPEVWKHAWPMIRQRLVRLYERGAIRYGYVSPVPGDYCSDPLQEADPKVPARSPEAARANTCKDAGTTTARKTFVRSGDVSRNTVSARK